MTLSPAPAPLQRLPPDDPALLARVRSGDMDALSTLYQMHASELLGLAARLTGSRSDAEDVVQDLFVGLSRSLQKYDERGRFQPWLKRLTVRLALIRLRAGRRRRETGVEELEIAWSHSTGEEVALRDAFTRLMPDDRAIILLKLVEGYSHSEIAELLEIRRGTSEVRLHRALERLRALLKEEA